MYNDQIPSSIASRQLDNLRGVRGQRELCEPCAKDSQATREKLVARKRTTIGGVDDGVFRTKPVMS